MRSIAGNIQRRFSTKSAGKYRQTLTEDQAANVMNNHQKLHPPIKCKLCYYASSSASNFRNHFCDYAYYKSSDLKTHLKTHQNEKLNKCNQCNFASSYRSSLLAHQKIHVGQKSNTCNHCEYSSTSASNLRSHMKTHTEEKSYKCDRCDYSSDLMTYLKFHDGEKSHNCDQCDYSS